MRPAHHTINSNSNKARYTAIQLQTVSKEQQCKNHSEFQCDGGTDRWTDGPTYRLTQQGVESRVRDLKTNFELDREPTKVEKIRESRQVSAEEEEEEEK